MSEEDQEIGASLVLIILGISFWTFLSFVLGGCSDHMLTYERQVTEYVYLEDTSIDSEDTSEPEIVYVPDTANDPIWIDSFTQVSSRNGIDIVWVIDRSGSMNNNLPKLEQGISAMMTILSANFDAMWRIGIISADSNQANNNNVFPLLYGDDALDAMNQVNALTGSREEGFAAFYNYYYNGYAETWMRSDAALLVIFVSDEDDQSQSLFSTALDFSNWYSNLRPSTYLASVTVTTTDCESALGKRYIEAVDAVQGQNVDICSEDWTPSIKEVTEELQPYEEWELTYVPIHGELGIYVFVDGVPYSDWHYDEPRNVVVFDVLPDGEAFVEIAYEYGG